MIQVDKYTIVSCDMDNVPGSTMPCTALIKLSCIVLWHTVICKMLVIGCQSPDTRLLKVFLCANSLYVNTSLTSGRAYTAQGHMRLSISTSALGSASRPISRSMRLDSKRIQRQLYALHCKSALHTCCRLAVRVVWVSASPGILAQRAKPRTIRS